MFLTETQYIFNTYMVIILKLWRRNLLTRNEKQAQYDLSLSQKDNCDNVFFPYRQCNILALINT